MDWMPIMIDNHRVVWQVQLKTRQARGGDDGILRHRRRRNIDRVFQIQFRHPDRVVQSVGLSSGYIEAHFEEAVGNSSAIGSSAVNHKNMMTAMNVWDQKSTSAIAECNRAIYLQKHVLKQSTVQAQDLS